MKRLFLFEIIADIRQAEDRKSKIEEYLQTSPMFKDFFDIVYNKSYSWEFDATYKKEPRIKRQHAGATNETRLAIRFIKRRLITPTAQGVNFIKQFDRILESVNINDIKIILYALNKRSIRYIDTKKIYQWFPELDNHE